MAKAVTAPPRRPRAPLAPATGGSGGRSRAGLVEYLRGVWDELRKVVWPTRDELSRMTGIVIATVVLFALLIGGADYVLGLGVKQLYSGAANAASATAAPRASTAPRAATTPSVTTAPTTPVPSP